MIAHNSQMNYIFFAASFAEYFSAIQFVVVVIEDFKKEKIESSRDLI